MFINNIVTFHLPLFFIDLLELLCSKIPVFGIETSLFTHTDPIMGSQPTIYFFCYPQEGRHSFILSMTLKSLLRTAEDLSRLEQS